MEKHAYNDIEEKTNSAFHKKANARSRNNSQIDAEESYPINSNVNTNKLRPRTAVFHRHN
jgi:hypothetical protein